MKDLIIGGYTRYNWMNLKNWVLSAKRSGFKGDIVLIAFNTDTNTVEKLKQEGVIVIPVSENLDYQSKIPIHVERFIHIYHYLKTNSSKYRYVVTTDVKDVIFQRNPVEWIENNLHDKNLIISSESIRYKDEPWGNENLMQTFGKYIYQEFKDKEIYNVGVIAGRFEYVKDLVLNLFLMSINRPIPIVDQATYNTIVHTYPMLAITKRTCSEDGWACQLGTTADPQKIESFKPHLLENIPIIHEGKVYTSKKNLFYIVHQYDRVPSLKTSIDIEYA